MTNWPTLKNAPITEALIDIRVQMPKGVGLAELAGFHDHIRDNYPIKRTRRTFETNLDLRETEPSLQNVSFAEEGYLFWSEDQKQVIQARLDGFSFSRLKPYETWARLRDEARKFWEVYRKHTSPNLINRIALRYIDLMELPLPFSNFKEWILTAPDIAPTLPQAMSSYLMRMVIPFDDLGTTAIVTQSLGPRQEVNTNTVPLIFDIDVFRTINVDTNLDEVWNQLEELRAVKNRIFFESITRKTEALFR